MTTSHTPGPWTVVFWPVNKLTEFAVRGEAPVATMARTNDAAANARLIAACPELLSFVERYVERFGAKAADEVDSPLVKEARALIAKATGA